MSERKRLGWILACLSSLLLAFAIFDLDVIMMSTALHCVSFELELIECREIQCLDHLGNQTLTLYSCRWITDLSSVLTS